MEAAEIVQDGYGRIRASVLRALDGLTAEQLAFRPTPNANSIAWLCWHLTRIQDSHLNAAIGGDQLWVTGPWAAELGRPAVPGDTGYGYTAEQVGEIRPAGPDVLRTYHEAVADRTIAHVGGLSPADLDEIVDRSYDPPVTLGVRLVSVISDNIQHVGQALYLKGMLADLM